MPTADGVFVSGSVDVQGLSGRGASQGVLPLPLSAITTSTDPPVATLVSPLAGVAAGAAGGFPSDPYLARYTPVVMQITDLDVGVQYALVVVRFGSDSTATEEVVYRRGTFRGRYRTSSAVTIALGVQLSIVRDGGWPAGVAVSQLIFDVDATDKAGNLDA